MEPVIISGIRIVSILNEDSTYPALQSNIRRTFPHTNKRQNAPAPNVATIKYTPHLGNASLEIDATVAGSDQPHSVTVLCSKVTFEPQDTPSNVTITTSAGSEQSLAPIQLARSNIRVRCTCMDFRFRFALWNFNDNSLMGEKPPPYVPTSNRPPVNPLRTPGVCKHIIATIRSAQQSGIVV